MLDGKNILLVISGGIAAYKSLELIRLIKKAGGSVRCVLTRGGEQFVTPLSVAALSENPVYTDLWSLKDETEMGHIRLSRECDLIVVAPASANLLARVAHGLADDLATTAILASDKPVLFCPAMNPHMWANAATRDNIELLRARRYRLAGPAAGDMACGEHGDGRLLEPQEILNEVAQLLGGVDRPLAGRKALVTAGPTYEPVDPVRFVGNRSSGKQGYAIAAALARLGAEVSLVSGPSVLPDPAGVKLRRIEAAREMDELCRAALPVDIAVCAAAVSDWAPAYRTSKIKKTGRDGLTVTMGQTVDVLAEISSSRNRPKLVVGFAAETDRLIENAREKLASKGCDWIVANLIDANDPVFGSDHNKVYLVETNSVEEWPAGGKDEIAARLAERIAARIAVLPEAEPMNNAAE